jgi:maltooligosyltrehalose trehalohydrolase
MQEIKTEARTLGVNYLNDGSVSVVVWAPNAEKVEVVMHETIALEKKEFGYWETVIAKFEEGTKYKIRVDNNEPFPDPVSLSQPDGVHGQSAVVNVGSFNADSNGWKNLPLEEYIIYELHTGTFTKEGTFAAIEDKLDYLKDLGITAIEIMPVAQFPGGRNWGYDGVFPFAVQDSYGGAKGLQRLVSVCHQKGLAVILDVVYNHFGPEGNYLNAFGPYFTAKYKTPWGSAINFDDEYCDGVRRYFIENVLMWFRDFGVDALRLDAVHAIKDFSATHILQEIKMYVDKLMQETGKVHYLITELDLNDTRFITPINSGGYGMDVQWIDEFHHALRSTATGEATGYYADFTGIDHLAKAYKDAFVYDGQWSPHRKKFFGVKAERAEGKQFIVFSQNHDQVGNRMLGERTSSLVSFEMQKLMAGAVLVAPFLPMLFMGEEWGEPNPFLYFVSHGDKDLCEAVRKGRKEEFAAFHLEGEAPDPVAEETFMRSKLQWKLIHEGGHKIMLDYYKSFISLRKSHPVLRHLDRRTLKADADKEAQTLVLHRWNDDATILAFMNFSKAPQTIPFANTAGFKTILDSAAKEWNGPGDSEIYHNAISIQPESIVILSDSLFTAYN